MDDSPIRPLGRNSPEGKQVEADLSVVFDEVEEEFQQRRQEAIQRRRRLQESRARSKHRRDSHDRDSAGPAGAGREAW